MSLLKERKNRPLLMGTETQTFWSGTEWRISKTFLNSMSSQQHQDGKTPENGLEFNWKVRNWTAMERTREEEEEEDKEEALEAEAEVEEEMTTRKTEELNPPE